MNRRHRDGVNNENGVIIGNGNGVIGARVTAAGAAAARDENSKRGV